LLVKDDLSGAIKAYQDTRKLAEELRGGVMEGRLLKGRCQGTWGFAVEGTAAQIAGALNALATKIAVGINEGSCFPRSQPEGSVREGTKQR